MSGRTTVYDAPRQQYLHGRQYIYRQQRPPQWIAAGTMGNPVVLDSGATDQAMDWSVAMGEQPSAPAFESGDAGTDVLWFSYTAPSGGTLTVTTPGESAVTEVYTDVDGAQLIGSGAPTTVVVGEGTEYLIRVHPQVGTDDPTTWVAPSLHYVLVVRTSVLTAQYTGGDTSLTVDATPTVVTIDVSGGAPDEPVNVYLDPATSGELLATFALDDDGVTSGQGISVATAVVVAGHGSLSPGGLTPGTHELAVQGTISTTTSLLTLVVTNLPTSVPTVPASDSGAPTVTAGVINKWRLVDPAPGGETYIFDVNPDKMASPNPPRSFSTDVTTAGRKITWEGARAAADWSFSGTVLNRSQLDAFSRFLALNRRVWVIDHLNRGWVITVEKIDAQPRRALNFPDAQTYSVSAFIYSGPVQSGTVPH